MMVITLVAALSMEATYDRVIEDPALRAKPWDVRVERPATWRRVAAPARRSSARRRSPACRSSTPRGEFQARAVGDGFEAFPYAVPDGRMFARPGEAIAGRGFFERLGAAGRRRRSPCAPTAGRSRVTLVGRHVEPDNDGEVVIFPAATLPERPAPAT